MKKKYIAVIAAAAIVLGGAFLSGKLSRSKAEKNGADTTAVNNTNTEEQPPSTIPIETLGDTDDERRYGYDVLYKHDGITITLLESNFNGNMYFADGNKNIKIAIKNETDDDITVYTEYVAANCYISNASLHEDVPAGETVEATIEGVNDLLNVHDQITDIELKFSFDIEYEPLLVYSDQIKIIYEYEDYPTEPRGDSKLLWAEAGFELYDRGHEITPDDDGNIRLKQNFYLRNISNEDYLYTATHYFFADGVELDNTITVRKESPAGCGYNFYIFLNPGEYVSAEQIDSISFYPKLYSYEDTYDPIYRGDEVVIDIE